MTDTARCFIVWGIIVFVICILSFCAYRWLSRVARFEGRKKEIAAGFCVCALAVASLVFLPVFFLGIDLNALGSQLSDSIQFADSGAETIGTVLVPFVGLFARFLAAVPLKYLKLIVIGIPVLASAVIIALVVATLFKLREPKKHQKGEYSRKHLFEYNGEIVSSLNKKK